MRLLLVCACLPGALPGSLLPGRRRGVDIRTRGSASRFECARRRHRLWRTRG